MPSTTLLEIPPAEQAQMRAILRRTRYGYLLAFHILLLCAAGRNPTEIAAFLFCSRSSVYRIVRVYRTGSLGIRVDQDGQLSIAVRMTVLMPWLTRSLGALLKKAPRAYGWCRTRSSCATLAATLQAKHGIAVSAETVRRWLHEIGWVWKRAKLVAKDNDPNGLSVWPAFGFIMNTCKPMRSWSLRMNSIFTSCPRSGRRGCRTARRPRS